MSERLYWCNSHQRRAMDEKRCAPGQSGILLPCMVVDLTDEVTIEDKDEED